MIFTALLAALLGQRLNELFLGKVNFKRNHHLLLTPLDQREKRQMVLLHALWFLACYLEYLFLGRLAVLGPFLIGILVLMACQLVRFQTMKELGNFWTPYPIAFRSQPIISRGPYKLVRHPNYLVVIIEVALVPLLGGCYYSAAVFSIANIFFLHRRIRLEEEALALLPAYKSLILKKKLVPFLY